LEVDVVKMKLASAFGDVYGLGGTFQVSVVLGNLGVGKAIIIELLHLVVAEFFRFERHLY
jgi:hypothetical protein